MEIDETAATCIDYSDMLIGSSCHITVARYAFCIRKCIGGGKLPSAELIHKYSYKLDV